MRRVSSNTHRAGLPGASWGSRGPRAEKGRGARALQTQTNTYGTWVWGVPRPPNPTKKAPASGQPRLVTFPQRPVAPPSQVSSYWPQGTKAAGDIRPLQHRPAPDSQQRLPTSFLPESTQGVSDHVQGPTQPRLCPPRGRARVNTRAPPGTATPLGDVHGLEATCRSLGYVCLSFPIFLLFPHVVSLLWPWLVKSSPGGRAQEHGTGGQHPRG